MNIEELFIQILNMSLTASYVILATIILRVFLKKTPKWVTFVLWGIASLRLILPFSFKSLQSVFSVIPSSDIVSPEILYSEAPTIHSGIYTLNSAVNPVITESMEPTIGASVNPMQIFAHISGIIWLVGIGVMLIYAILSYVKLKKKMASATLLRDNIYQSENVESPFLLGFIKPRIYVSYTLSEPELSHVLNHENAHIQRRDYLLKPLAFFILTLHWFNPLVWIAYTLFCRDIELACDERVIKGMAVNERKSYSGTLLALATGKNRINACPLAFGEVSVKSRIKNVLSYKKPAFWIIICAIVVCVVAAVCLLTNPFQDSDEILNTVEFSDLNKMTDISELYGTYHPTEVLYVNPLSSFYPFDLDSAPYYTFAEKEFTIVTPGKSMADINNSPLYVWSTITIDEFNDMFFSDLGMADISQYESIKRITLTDSYSLYIVGDELWLAQFSGEHIWFIYNLQPSDSYTPEQLSENKWLTIDALISLVNEKGDTLTWSDFEDYEHTDIGSGFYIWQLPINADFSVLISGIGVTIAPMFIRLVKLSTDGTTTDDELDLRAKDADVQSFVNSFAENPEELTWEYIPNRSVVFPALPISIDMNYATADITVDNGSLYIHGSGETKCLGNTHTYMSNETIYWSPFLIESSSSESIAESCVIKFTINDTQGNIHSGQIKVQSISNSSESISRLYSVLLTDGSNDLSLKFDYDSGSWGNFVLSLK